MHSAVPTFTAAFPFKLQDCYPSLSCPGPLKYPRLTTMQSLCCSFVYDQQQEMIGQCNMFQYFPDGPSLGWLILQQIITSIAPIIKRGKSAEHFSAYPIDDESDHIFNFSWPSGNRTRNPGIKNPVLRQLSYGPVSQIRTLME
jgi:hypothetical protein